jgi:hypothetical protein
MIQVSSHQLKRNQSVSNSKFSPAELANHRANRNELGERCRVVFEKIRPQLIKNYENWLIAIEPETEHYLIAPQLDELVKQIKQYYPNNEVKLTIFKLNQVGSCGKI